MKTLDSMTAPQKRYAIKRISDITKSLLKGLERIKWGRDDGCLSEEKFLQIAGKAYMIKNWSTSKPLDMSTFVKIKENYHGRQDRNEYTASFNIPGLTKHMEQKKKVYAKITEALRKSREKAAVDVQEKADQLCDQIMMGTMGQTELTTELAKLTNIVSGIVISVDLRADKHKTDEEDED